MTTSAFFLAYLGAVVLAVAAVMIRRLDRRIALGLLAALSAWLLYVGLLGCFDVVQNASARPPGIVFVVAPVVLFLSLFAARSAAGLRLALAVPVG